MRVRHATPEDGATMWRLVRDAGTLELNSPYAYLLMATHFAATCLVAEDDDEALGMVIAYRPPEHVDAVFVWQIGVAPRARGRGVGKRLILELASVAAGDGARYLEASVTPGNHASHALFLSVARELGAEHRIRPFLDAELFPQSHETATHETEELVRIGPFEPAIATLSASC